MVDRKKINTRFQRGGGYKHHSHTKSKATVLHTQRCSGRMVGAEPRKKIETKKEGNPEAAQRPRGLHITQKDKSSFLEYQQTLRGGEDWSNGKVTYRTM